MSFQIQMEMILRMILYYKSFANNEHGLGNKLGKIMYLLCHQITYANVFITNTLPQVLTVSIFSFSQVDSVFSELLDEQPGTSTLMRDT